MKKLSLVKKKKPIKRLRSSAKKENRELQKNVGKIGWVDRKTLGLNDGHYVFIREVNKKGKCKVNTLSSIKTRKGDGYQKGKIAQIEKGLLYPVPKQDDTLPRFGGIYKGAISNIPLSKIEDIGKHKIKKKHHQIIKKLMK